MKIPHFKKILTAFLMAVIVGVVTLGVTGASSEVPLYNPSEGDGVAPTFTGLNVTGDATVENQLSSMSLVTSLISNNNYPVLFAADGLAIRGNGKTDYLQFTNDTIINDDHSTGDDLLIGSHRGLSLNSTDQLSIATETGAGIWLGGSDGTENIIKIDGDISTLNGSTPVTIDDDLNVSNHISASSIGDYVWRQGTLQEVSTNGLVTHTAACNSGEIAIFCGYSTGYPSNACGSGGYCQGVNDDSDKIFFHNIINWGNSCDYLVQAEEGANILFMGQILCFNPDL